MGKIYKNKSRSCGLCKPHKRGLANKNTNKTVSLIKETEKEIITAKQMDNEKEKFTFFWDGPFSQWYSSPFKSPEHPGITFNCAEQYMMYSKALIMEDNETAASILLTNSPREQKALGRKIKNFDATKWDAVKENIVTFGSFLKYTQNKDLQKHLFDTEGTVLVEASPYDKIWGIGLAEDNINAQDRKTWQGLNLLGEILTRLRDDLIQSEIDFKNDEK